MNRNDGTVYTVVESPIGDLTLVGDGAALSALYFPDHARRPDGRAFGPRDDDAFAAARVQLAE